MAKKKGKAAAETTDEGEAPEATKRASSEAFSGARLKKIREDKGLTIAELSSRTKISKAVLQALEEERYANMPNARVYVRGFVRCVARELELDLDAVSKSYLPAWERWFSEQPEGY